MDSKNVLLSNNDIQSIYGLQLQPKVIRRGSSWRSNRYRRIYTGVSVDNLPKDMSATAFGGYIPTDNIPSCYTRHYRPIGLRA